MQTRGRRAGAHGTRRGSALVTVTMAAAVLATLSFSLLAVSFAGAKEQRGAKEKIRARYVCEAALSDAVLDMASGGSGNLGEEDDPLAYGSGNYWVETTPLAGEMFQLVATGREDRAGARLELTVQRSTSSLFQWGAFGDEGLVMDSNARTDSYVSTLGTYASQAVNGSGSSAWAKANGDVGSNKNVHLKQNSKAWGDALPGPGGSTTIEVNATVSGSTAPLSQPLELPPISVPTITSGGPLTVSGTGTVIPSGDHRWTSFTVNKDAKVTVVGPARLVVDDFQLKSNSQMIIDASAGPVELYVNGDFILDSNTLLASTTYTPADVVVNLLSDNVVNPDITVQLDIITFESNAKMFAALYAPDTVIDIDSNFELFGSLVARHVTLDSNTRVHYDEALASASSTSEYTFQTVCWRVLPYRP